MPLTRRSRTGASHLDHRHNGTRYRFSLKTADRRVAEYHASQFIQKLQEDGLPPAFKRVPIGRALLAYWHEVKVTLRPRHARQHLARLIDLFRCGQIRVVPDLSSERLQRLLLSEHTRRVWKPKSYNNYRGDIQAFGRWLVYRRWLSENPALRMRRLKVDKNQVIYLADAELEQIQEALAGHWLWPAVATAIYAGLRVEEIKALHWEDVDLTARTITVRGRGTFRTKSGRFRVVPISTGLGKILGSVPRSGPFVFRRKDLQSAWLAVRLEKHLPMHWHWRNFRHTFGTQFALRGEMKANVTEWMGHSDSRVTDRYYIGQRNAHHEGIERFSPP